MAYSNAFFGRVVLTLALSGSIAACGPTSTGNGTGDGDGGSSGTDAPTGTVIDGGGGNVVDALMLPDASCGAQTEDIGLVNLGDPPDMLIVLDRSGSMQLPPGFPPTGPTKWASMVAALKSVTAAKDNNIRFGLSYFPTDDLCGVAAGTDVAVQLPSASLIASSLDSRSPNGNTPAHTSLQQALATYNAMTVNPAGRYVLFATDGAPNCGGSPPVPDTESDAETVAAVTALASAGIKTFVIGFGSTLGLDEAVLNDSAIAGGVPNPGGPPHYYPATNAAQLQTQLDLIAGGIIVPTCSYELASAPPDPDLVTVTLDGTPVPRDASHTNGWDYYPDAMTITFFGSYCATIESSTNASVSFVFGCPGPVVN